MENFNALIANAQNSIANLRESIASWCRKNVNLVVEFKSERVGIWGEDSENMLCYHSPVHNTNVVTNEDVDIVSDIYNAPIEDVIAIAQAIADKSFREKNW